MHEARIEDTDSGRRPVGDGWFILNLAEMHCPPDTEHITVGAGEEPCAILMVGTRTPGHTIHYPANPIAAEHGASVQTDTDSAAEAYADRPPFSAVPSPWPLDSP